jgi:hypothetical protein
MANKRKTSPRDRPRNEGAEAAFDVAKNFIEELRRSGKRVPIQKFIRVDMVFNGPGTTGWVHTHHMWEVFGLPDLEIRDVSPLFLMEDAGRTLNHIAQYMVDSQSGFDGAKEVKLGQRFGLSQFTILSFEQSLPINPKDPDEVNSHFIFPRWQVVNGLSYKCEKCEKGEHHVH